MSDKEIFPFAPWPSVITPGKTGGLLDISEPAWNSQGSLLWRERQSSRASIMMASFQGERIEDLSGSYNPGGSLLYGGGAYDANGERLVFVDRSSGQLITARLDGTEFQPVTENLVQAASPKLSPDGRSILVVHSDGENDALWLVKLDGEEPPLPLVEGADFYNYPRWHPDGNQLAWMSWDHPHMPWDTSEIWLGRLDQGSGAGSRLLSRERIAGGEGISVLQPEFSPDGKWLAYLSDQSGWWQLHLYELDHHTHTRLTSAPAEGALPPWLQDREAFGFSPDSQRIYFLRNQDGFRSLWAWNLATGKEARIDLDETYTWLDWLAVSPLEDRLAAVASASDIPPRLITISPEGKTAVILQANPEALPRELFSRPQPLSWSSAEGITAHGLFYQPHHPRFQGSEKPPLLVIIHSGPTRQKFAEFQPRTQYFTSRGYAVLEVNYRGSSGYGRAYRQALKGLWGVADVEDCLSGALYTAERGWADRKNIFLLGSSSGGLTVFQALLRFPGLFRAGVALYPVVNHLALLEDPPKFERYYADWLIGPYPEREKDYRERSPVFFADRIQDPVAVFQGGADPIVPREQTEQIVQALKANGVPCQYQLYPDEGHGFKRSENITDLYKRIEGFLQENLAGK